MTLQEIKRDLRTIRYYYSKQKEFEKAAETVGTNRIVEIVEKYNQAATNAPLKLYEVYVGLYINNNTQEAFAFDSDCSTEYIRRLNKELCIFLLNYFQGES